MREFTGSEDGYGNEVPTERLVTTVCEVQPRTNTEASGADDSVAFAAWVGFFLPGTSLNSGDAVSVDGLGEFEVNGDPAAWRNPRTQTVDYVEATLERTAGPEDGS